jgi:hypothetical protein
MSLPTHEEIRTAYQQGVETGRVRDQLTIIKTMVKNQMIEHPVSYPRFSIRGR